jgi:hypothetical protein
MEETMKLDRLGAACQPKAIRRLSPAASRSETGK